MPGGYKKKHEPPDINFDIQLELFQGIAPKMIIFYSKIITEFMIFKPAFTAAIRFHVDKVGG